MTFMGTVTGTAEIILLWVDCATQLPVLAEGGTTVLLANKLVDRHGSLLAGIVGVFGFQAALSLFHNRTTPN